MSTMEGWVNIAEFKTAGEAGLAESVLRAAEIPFEMTGDDLVGGAFPGTSIGRARLFVPPDRAEEAYAALEPSDS